MTTANAQTYAQAAVRALHIEMALDERVVVLGEDVGRGGIFGQYTGLQAQFGSDRIIDTPISEAAIMGAGVGMALAGMRPVVEMRVVDFALCGMDEVINQAAKNRYMFGGQGRVPLVMRMPIGIWDASAAQHSQSLEAWFAHMPGLVVVCPSSAQDNFSLLRSALASGDPVVYMEHKTLWGREGIVDEGLQVPLGKARKITEGSDLSIVSWSRQVSVCEQAVQDLQNEGLSIDLIDLRTIWPWDREAVLSSCAKTGKLLVVHEAIQAAGFGAEIAATAAQETGCQIRRLGAQRIPVGYSQVLENEARVSREQMIQAVKSMFL